MTLALYRELVEKHGFTQLPDGRIVSPQPWERPKGAAQAERVAAAEAKLGTDSVSLDTLEKVWPGIAPKEPSDGSVRQADERREEGARVPVDGEGDRREHDATHSNR